MPYPVYPVQNQTAQQLSNIGSNLGVAMFGDANSMMRRSQLNQDLKFKQAQLDLQRQELSMKGGVYSSQAAMNNAKAQGYSSQNQGSSELADVLAQASVVNPDGSVAFDPQRIGAVAGAAARANPEGDVAKLMRGLSAMSIQQRAGGSSEDQYRQAAALDGKMPSENTAFTTGQATAMAAPQMIPANTQGVITSPNSVYNKSLQDYGAGVNDSSGVPASVLPSGQSNPYYTPDGGPAPAPTPAPLPASDPNGLIPPTPAAMPVAPQTAAPAAPTASVADAFVTPVAPQQKARMSGSALVLPQKPPQQWGTASSRAKSDAGYAEDASNYSSLAATARGLLEGDAYKQIPFTGGGIPVVESVSKRLIGMNDGNRSNLINQYQTILTGDWLSKSGLLKGAITEAEGRELRKDQPGLGDNPDAIKGWLERVAYVSQMRAEHDSLNQQRTEQGLPPVNSLDFKRAYAAQVPPPASVKLSFAPSLKQGEFQQAVKPQQDPDADLNARLKKYN